MQRALTFKGLHGIQLILSSHSIGLELNSILLYFVSPTCTSSGLLRWTKALQKQYCCRALYFSPSWIMTFCACLLRDDSSQTPSSFIAIYSDQTSGWRLLGGAKSQQAGHIHKHISSQMICFLPQESWEKRCVCVCESGAEGRKCEPEHLLLPVNEYMQADT